MHFALPPRRTSQPPPYARASRNASRYRVQTLRLLGYGLCSLLAIYFLFLRRSAPIQASTSSNPLNRPLVVIVTVFDEEHLNENYIDRIKTNRRDYAQRHGYENFFTSTTSYDGAIRPAPPSWAIVPALRQALSQYPHTTHFFSLSPHALIMAPSLALHEHILNPLRLESLMLKDTPVIPPDSMIHTFGHLKADAVDLVMSQDGESLSHGSFILRQGEWSRFFLDTWFDPLFRNYKFQKAEGHALEHIVQWHPTILAKLALVPQRIMNSFNFETSLSDGEGLTRPLDSKYQKGDLLVRFHGCDSVAERDCDKELEPYWTAWEEEIVRIGALNTLSDTDP